MNFRICIVTMTPKLVSEALFVALGNCLLPPEVVSVIVGANSRCIVPSDEVAPGSVTTASVWPERVARGAEFTTLVFEDNEGVVPAMHKIWSHVHASGARTGGNDDFLAYIHDDCLMLERGWDSRIVDMFKRHPECDVIGFVGGTGIGAHDIYRTPYQMIQLGRHNVHSNMTNAEAHGVRTAVEMQIATCDGCGFVVRRSLLDRLAGWSTWWPEPNHGYDNALACMLRRLGRQMWLCPTLFEHPSPLKLSGKHVNAAAMERHNERFGTDQEVHARSHRRLYDEFRDVLPFHVP